eukprot:525995_1
MSDSEDGDISISEDDSSEDESEDDIQMFKYNESEFKPVKSMIEFKKRFKIGQLLGSGGDGNVYSDQIKKWAAIKKIEITNMYDNELQQIQAKYELQRAQQEQCALFKSKIANMYGIYHNPNENIMYKIYDRYDYTLADIIDKFQFGMNESQIKYIIYNICCDVKKLHNEQFIHCDIKPSNILYCKKGTYYRKYRDKRSFKLIDFDGMVWNNTDDIVNTQWQGTLPFIAPEMNDYSSDNNIGYGIDVWCIGLVILYCLNGGHLGLMDIDDINYNKFYQQYDEKYDKEMEIKSLIFDDWYDELFGQQMKYKNEIKMLFENDKISKDLYDLLYHGILIKDPQQRMNINEVLAHKWFDSLYENNSNENIQNVLILGKRIDLYDAIMSNDTMIRFEVIKQLGFELINNGNDINKGIDINNGSCTDTDNDEK